MSYRFCGFESLLVFLQVVLQVLRGFAKRNEEKEKAIECWWLFVVRERNVALNSRQVSWNETDGDVVNVGFNRDLNMNEKSLEAPVYLY